MDEIPAMSRSESPNKKHIKDPHSSLDLFEPSKPDANRNRSQSGVAVRDSIKPPQRELFDISAGHGEYEPGRSRSPERKEDRQSTLAVKGGAGQRYQPSRLFDEAPDPDSPVMYKSNPAKYASPLLQRHSWCGGRTKLRSLFLDSEPSPQLSLTNVTTTKALMKV